MVLKRGKRGNVEQGLTVQQLRFAEVAILRYVRGRRYASEIKSLSEGRGVGKSSTIGSLDPVLDSDGVIRVGGRLKRARVAEDFRSPYLVPHDYPIAKLIANDFHNIAHCGTERVTCEIRKKYWVTSVRSVVKRVAHGCIFCRRMFAKPCSQKMADLPSERLEFGKRPFTYTGVDCFGPFFIKQGRVEVKR
ncbi:uncharacterized protein [Palaemon carinicauda]|uniref:uncharacterized protein n=1 Tax=Palaemon carinicauda TaxID=392227 RepID=UPI0035B69B03